MTSKYIFVFEKSRMDEDGGLLNSYKYYNGLSCWAKDVEEPIVGKRKADNHTRRTGLSY